MAAFMQTADSTVAQMHAVRHGGAGGNKMGIRIRLDSILAPEVVSPATEQAHHRYKESIASPPRRR